MIFKIANKVVGEIAGGIFTKSILEEKHLLWAMGGSPGIDAQIWDANKDKVEEIKIRTNRGKVFSISKEAFEQNKEVKDYGWRRQYFVHRDCWNIIETGASHTAKLFTA